MFVTSFSFRLSTNILQVLLEMAVGLFGFTISATADVLSEREVAFKGNAASMKAFRNAFRGRPTIKP